MMLLLTILTTILLQISCSIGHHKITKLKFDTAKCNSVTLIPNKDIFLKRISETELRYLGHKWLRINDANIQTSNSFLQLRCENQNVTIVSSHSKTQHFPKLVRMSVPFGQHAIVILTPSTKPMTAGYLGEIINFFIKKCNVSFAIIRNKDKKFGALINGSWTGMIGDLTQGTADIAFGAVTRTRGNYINFSPQLTSQQIDLVYKKLDQHEWNYGFYLQPCSIKMWLCIFAISFTVILLKVLANFLLTKENFGNCFHSFIHELLLCWPIVLQSNLTSFSLKSMRSLFVIYIVFSTLLWISYTSVFTSFLATVDTKIPFTSLADMLGNTDYMPMVVEGNEVEEIFQKPPYENIKVIKVESLEEGIESVYKGKVALLYSFRSLQHSIGKNCSFTVASHYVRRGSISLFYSKQFAYTGYFNSKILMLKEYGILPVEIKRTFPEVTPCQENPFNKISIGQTIGPFVLIVAAILISLIFGLIELIVNEFIT